MRLFKFAFYLLLQLLMLPNANAASTNLTELMQLPGVVNPAGPPNPDFPLDQDVPFRVAADNETVVYIVNNAFFSLKYADPANPIRLTSDLIGRIREFELSPDSQWLVYTLEQDELIPGEMSQRAYSVRIDGVAPAAPVGPAAVITPAAPGGIGFQITFDSQRVVFTASEPVTDPMFPGFEVAGLRLYSAPIQGGIASELTSGPRAAVFFELSYDSQYVVHAQTQETGLFPPPLLDLFSTRLSSLVSTRLHASGSAVFARFDITDDSSKVIYVDVDTESAEPTEISSVPIGGGPATTMATFGTQVLSVFMEATPDSQRAVYTVSDLAQGAQLFSAAVSGGDVDLLSEGLVADTIRFNISSDSEYVIFNAFAGSEDDIRSALYSVPTSVLVSATPQKIAGSLDEAASALLILGIDITLNSTHTVYSAIRPDDTTEEKPGATDVWSAEIDGTTPPVLLSELAPPAAARIPYFALAADSRNLLYLGDQTTPDQFEVFTVPVTGGEITTVNGPLSGSADVPFAFWTLNSTQIVYQADEAQEGIFDLWLYELPLFESDFEM